MLTVLVLVVLFTQSVIVSCKSSQLRVLKWNMKTQIIQASSAADLISFSFSEAAWMNLYKPDPTEFVMEGVYYDIAKVETTAEGVRVSCLKDEKEGLFKAKLKRWMNDVRSPYHKTQKSLRDFIKVLKFFEAPVKISAVFSSAIIHSRCETFGFVANGFEVPVAGPPWLGSSI